MIAVSGGHMVQSTMKLVIRLSALDLACNRTTGAAWTARLMAEHGADMPIPELLRILSADRPRRQAMESWPRYPDPDSVARVSPTAARPGPGRARTAWPPRLGTAVLDHMQHRERSDEWAAWPQIRLGRQLGRVGGQRWESGLTSAHPPWIADWIPIDWAA